MRLFGHPPHAALVHFPMALGILVFPLGAAAWLLSWSEGWRLSFFANAGGLALALPTAATGFLDLLPLRDDAKASGAALRHLLIVGLALTFLAAALAVQGGPAPPAGGAAIATLGLSLAGLALLAWGGWLGAELVYRHRAGIRPEEERKT